VLDGLNVTVPEDHDCCKNKREKRRHTSDAEGHPGVPLRDVRFTLRLIGVLLSELVGSDVVHKGAYLLSERRQTLSFRLHRLLMLPDRSYGTFPRRRCLVPCARIVSSAA
jgi:hypothetical protein